MKYCKINRSKTPFDAKINLPSSKSISNRLLLIKSICEQSFEIFQLSKAEDTVLMDQLVNITKGTVDVRDAGTVMRFLTAKFAATPGTDIFLTGTERLCQRPIGALVDALNNIGARIDYKGKTGFLPLKIKGKKLKGRKVLIESGTSSQYVSALLMVSPLLKNGLELTLKGKIVSQPYITMTLDIMKLYGISYFFEKNVITIEKGQNYKPIDIEVESDWSSASYWYGICALFKGSKFRFKGLKKESLQGDSIMAEFGKAFGIETLYDNDGVIILNRLEKQKFLKADLMACPDLTPALTVICRCLGMNFEFTGVSHLSLKESDRKAAIKEELEKTNYKIEYNENSIKGTVLDKNLPDIPIQFNSHNDHRIAMSLAIAAVANPLYSVSDPEVVKKSYPRFWEEVDKLIA